MRRLLTAAVVVAVWALASSGQALAQATLVVDDDGFATATNCNDLTTPAYMTISAAEAAASPGDTIVVCPGFYFEQVFVDVPNLTFLGAQAFVDARTRPFVFVNESIVHHPCGPVQLAHDNIVWDGFTVEGSAASDPCFIAGIWTNPGYLGTTGGHTIVNNIVQNNIIGIQLVSFGNSTLVRHNLIHNNNNPGPAGGTGIYEDLGLVNTTIHENTFSGPHLSRSMTLLGTGSNITIVNNMFDTGGGSGVGLCNKLGMVIRDNTSLQSAAGSIIGVGGNNTDIAIERNNLRNGQRGIRVSTVCGGQNASVRANINNIVNNAVAGLEVEVGGHVGTMNSECNWWGSVSGPFNAAMNPTGTGNQVIGDADFIPWLRQPFEVSTTCVGRPEEDDDDGDDDDDFDDDDERDDEDGDDDNDGEGDDEDGDDDNDGEGDDEDEDDDNDGIDDVFDSESAMEYQQASADVVGAGQEKAYDLSVGATALLSIATAEATGATDLLNQSLTVEIYNPSGVLIARSPAALGRVVATAVPALPGTYKVKVKNSGSQTTQYRTSRIVRTSW